MDKAAEDGIQWLLSQQSEDGCWQDVSEKTLEAFYKSSWAFVEAGQIAAAHRVLNYVGENLLNDSGDLTPRKKDVHKHIHYPYPNAYVAIGGRLTGRYEISRPIINHLLTRQDSSLGGFYSGQNSSDFGSQTDTISTAAGGLACLVAGENKAAIRAGEYLDNLRDKQTSPERAFYTTVNGDGELITDVVEDRTAYEDTDWYRIIETDMPNQCWYALGLPFAFLIQLWQATDQKKYQELSEWYFDFLLACEDPWTGGSSGKAGWGSSLMYRITGKKRYKDVALKVADYIIDQQRPNGNWAVSDADEMFTIADFDISSEYTLWLKLTATNLAVAPH